MTYTYYLDTNTLYQIKKVPERTLESCFYSVFNLLELIAGIDYGSFAKRKTIIGNVINSDAKCDYTFPEEILFRSFGYFNEFNYTEERVDDLFGVIDDIAASNSFDEFLLKVLLNRRNHSFYHFVDIDKFMTNNFHKTSVKGNNLISNTLKPNLKTSISFIGKKFDLNSRRDLFNFLNEDRINSSFTILALAKDANRIFVKERNKNTEKKIYNSYNGQLDIFIKGFSEYSKRQIINDASPQKNDFQDLTQLYYLRNLNNIMLVSDDKLFRKIIPEHVITLHTLTKTNLH